MSPEVSMMQLLHFLQLHTSGKFQQFDHLDQNIIHYNSPNPPEYDLSKVTAPIHLYGGSQDNLIPPEDVETLRKLLPNVRSCEDLEDWNHIDVMLGRDSRDVLYSKILKSMNKKQNLN
jgi:pimeloyl-ACP methyl ester carboxylesterase